MPDDELTDGPTYAQHRARLNTLEAEQRLREKIAASEQSAPARPVEDRNDVRPPVPDLPPVTWDEDWREALRLAVGLYAGCPSTVTVDASQREFLRTAAWFYTVVSTPPVPGDWG
jgi:hypothetical protein